MKITIDNMVTLTGGVKEINDKIFDELTIPNPDYKKLKKLKNLISPAKLKRALENTPQYLYYCDYFNRNNTDIRVERGHFGLIRRMYKGFKYEIVDNSNVGESINLMWNEDVKPYDYQLEAITAGYKKNGLIVAPTGAGKTIIGLALIQAIGKRAVWLTHTKDLQNQAIERIKHCLPGAKIGVIGGGKKANYFDKDIVVATVQTLMTDRNKPMMEYLNNHCGLFFIDEAHHTPSSTFKHIINSVKTRRILGVTATPTRKDGMHVLMKGAIGKELIRIDRSVVGSKILDPVITFIYTDFKGHTAIKSEGNSLDMGGEGSEYHELLKQVYDDDNRANLIVNTIHENARTSTGQTLVLTESISYGEKIIELLKNRGGGYNIEFVTGSLGKKKREKILSDTVDGKVNILFATQLAREGLDIPGLHDVHLITSKKGDSRAGVHDGNSIEQEVGRVLRYDPKCSNKIARVFDYVDYHNDIFNRQYITRRRTYMRLNWETPIKPKKQVESKSGFDVSWME